MFASLSPVLGTQPFNDWFVPDTTARHPLGTVIPAVDPYWGQGEFIYIKSTDTLVKGSLVMWDEAYAGLLLPTTANQGFPFGVSMAPATTGKYCWLQISGLAVYKTNATVAADAALAVATAGVAGASITGKQLVNVRNRLTATSTRTTTANVQASQTAILCPAGYDGFFVGMALSGSGIVGSTVVAALDPDGKRIYTGSAVGTTGDKNPTSSGSFTLTGTYTGFGAGLINRPFAQGAIT